MDFFYAMCEIYYFDNIIFNPLNSKSFISWPTTCDPLERCTLQRTYIHSSLHIDYPSHVSARNMCIYYKISERCSARAFVSTLESIKPLPRLHEICTFIFLSTTNSNISDKNVIENSKQFLPIIYHWFIVYLKLLLHDDKLCIIDQNRWMRACSAISKISRVANRILRRKSITRRNNINQLCITGNGERNQSTRRMNSGSSRIVTMSLSGFRNRALCVTAASLIKARS